MIFNRYIADERIFGGVSVQVLTHCNSVLYKHYGEQYYVIFHKRGQVLHQGFQTQENWWNRGAAIVFECLETLMKHEARVYEMASQKGLIL